MVIKRLQFLNSRGAHLMFSLLLVGFYYARFPLQEASAVISFMAIMLFYLGIIWMPKYWWSSWRYIIVTLVLIVCVTLLRIAGADYLDHSIIWPLLAILALSEQRWKRTTSLLAVIVIIMIVILMLFDGFSVGAMIAAVLMYTAIRGQSLLSEADRTNRKQLAQLNKAYSELQTSSVQAMGYAALTERTRLAREIHDGLGHQMTSLIVQLQALKLMIPNDPPAAEANVTELLKVARKGMEEIRLVAKEWSADENGLGPAALKGLISQIEAYSQVKISYEEHGELTEWSEEQSVIIYRVLQEALTNILKHSRAKNVSVLLEEQDEHIMLIVVDDGIFSPGDGLELGFGLAGMVERCESVGGSCTFSSHRPHGLKVQALIPTG